MEQIKASVNLPFHSFVGRAKLLQPLPKEPAEVLESVRCEELSPVQTASSIVEDVILLESNANNIEESENGEATNEKLEHREDKTPGSALEMDDGDEIMSLSDLSSSFQKCLKSMGQTRKSNLAEKSKESYDGFLGMKPFDYEAARKQFRFGEDLAAAESGKKGDDEGYSRSLDKVSRKKSSVVVGQSHKDEETRDFPQGRRRQAFPASGNRSATFR